MTTRSQALLGALEEIDTNIIGTGERIEAALSLLESQNHEHAAAMRKAYIQHGESIQNGMIAGAAVLVVGLIAKSVFDVVLNKIVTQAKEDRQFVQMFDSVVCLFERHGGQLKYNFVVERSYAEGTTKEQRSTLLNSMIYYGIIEDNYKGNKNMLYLDPESEEIFNIYESFRENGLIQCPEVEEDVITIEHNNK